MIFLNQPSKETVTTLHDILWKLTVDNLRMRLDHLKAKAPSVRKADLINTIKLNLEEPRLKIAWEALSSIEKLAVSEAVYDPEHRHHPVKFEAKYGSAAEFYRKPAEKPHQTFWRSEKNATALNIFLYHDDSSGHHIIPHDLALRLRPHVPQPRAVSVSCVPEPLTSEGYFLRYTEAEALTEFGALLRLASLGGLRFGPTTGIPSKAALTAIQPLLVGGDWYPAENPLSEKRNRWDQEIGFIKPVGWTRLLHSAGLITMNGSKSELTAAGRRAIDVPAWDSVSAIWQKWLSNKIYDEFNRIDVIKGQSIKGVLTARIPRRMPLLQALNECPANEWILFDGFSQYMRAASHMFEVASDTWKLYISDPQYGSLGYDGFGGWNVLQDRYLLCFLMEYAATLGLIDIAYSCPKNVRPLGNWGMDDYAWLSRYDGLHAFRINPLGAYVLSGGKTAYKPSRLQPQVRLIVLTNGTIHVSSGTLSPAERIQMETWAEPVSETSFRFESIRAVAAVEAGNDPDLFAQFLQERDEQALPETMGTFLQQARMNGEAVRQSSSAILFECRDAATAELIASRKELSKLCLRAGETTLAVREDCLSAFRKQVRALGLGVR